MSSLSPILLVPLANAPSKPSAPTIVSTTKTSISLSWSGVVASTTQAPAGDVKTYLIFMRDLYYSSEFKQIYTTNGNPAITTLTVSSDIHEAR